MSVTDRQTSDGTNVAGQTQLQFATREIPDFNDPVSRTSSEPFVTWFDSDTTHPAQMAGYDANELPRRVVSWFHGYRLLVKRQGF